LVRTTDHEVLYCAVVHSRITVSNLGPSILNNLFSDTSSLCSSFSMKYQVLHPYKTTGKIIVTYISMYIFLDTKWKIQDSAPNESN